MGNHCITNGWDLVVATKQRNINAQLKRIPSIPLKGEFEVPDDLGDIKFKTDVLFENFRINVNADSGRLFEFKVDVRGKLITSSGKEIELRGEDKDDHAVKDYCVITITTDLAAVRAVNQSKAGEGLTEYDLNVNFHGDAFIFNVGIDMKDPGRMAAVFEMLRYSLKKVFTDRSIRIASYFISNEDVKAYKPLIPVMADFSFVRSKNNPEESNLLVLMQTVTKLPGNIFFNDPVLPESEDFAALYSNRLFMLNYVLPAVRSGLIDNDASKKDVEKNLVLESDYGEVYQIKNTGTIDLDKDHDPWVNDFQVTIDKGTGQLYFYTDVKADVTFLEVHVESWVKNWQVFSINNGELGLTQVKEDTGSSSDLEWWKYLIGFLVGGFLGYSIMRTISQTVNGNIPSMGGLFKNVGTDFVKWPNQKYINVKRVASPEAIVLFLKVDFDF